MADIMTESDIDDQPISRAELLINMLLDDSLNDAEFGELSTMLERSEDARTLYVDLMMLHADLVDYYRTPAEVSKSNKPPVLGFLANSAPWGPGAALGETGS